MTYNDGLAQRVRQILGTKDLPVEEKKMMGGLTFMVDQKMCVGILKDELMARIAPEEYETALKKPDCRPMDFTGRPMPGFVFINNTGTASAKDLSYWVSLALAFNPRAKKSRTKNKK